MKSLFKSFSIICLLFIVLQVSAKKRVACIGDSVTKGYGIQDSSKNYPSRLQQLLGDEFVVGNFGHSGATLLRKGHNPYHKTQAYKDALAFKPDIIVVALGLNDTDPRNWPNYKNEFLGDYSNLIADFKKVNPQLEVFVCKMTPIFSGHYRFLSGTRDWFDQIQTLIPQIAIANSAKLIDNHAILASRIDLFDDYLHPNARGAELLAKNVSLYLKPIEQPLSLHETLGNHMVFQRHVVNKLKGKSSAGQKIHVKFNSKTFNTIASDLGIWEVEIPAQSAGGPYTIDITTSKEIISLSDVLFGDVYLSSGQSNMAFHLRAALSADTIIHQADSFEKIRIFKNKNLVETYNTAWDSHTLDKVNELEYFTGQWQKSTKESVAEFSAIAYMTAVELYKSQGVPIGIIDISVGGSNTESWIPRTVLEHDNLLATYIHSWKTSDFVQDFCRERGAKNIAHTVVKHQRHPYDPSYNFEAGLSKWMDTKVNGILWYQGESNAHNIEHHEYVFKVLVDSWRKAFKADLPFYFVQLSSINRPSWPDFRDSQRRLSNAIPHVYMAVSSDVGHPTDVHPTNKLIVGKRLADLIRQHSYKENIIADSPQPITYKKEKDKVILEFNNCKSLKTIDDKSISELQYVTNMGEIVEVNHAKIEQNCIVIPIDSRLIKYIQYGYKPYSEGNLISDSGVPVSTFSLKID